MTEQKLEKLLPCPFHKLNTSVDLTDNDYGRWFVVCGGCGASSGHCKTKERAVYSWNNDRSSTTREVELQAEVKRLREALEKIVYSAPACDNKTMGLINDAKQALNHGSQSNETN